MEGVSMPTPRGLASKFSGSSLDKARVRAFADHVSKVETQNGISLKKALINGLPPFDDVPAVEFEVPKTKLDKVIKQLLGSEGVNPNVIINGIPALDHFTVRVVAGR
jgi:hypothetical protein